MLADDRPSPLQSTLLAEGSDGGIRHGFFTRGGGVSSGLYRGLNVGLGSQDNPDDIIENRERVCRWFGVGAKALATPHQIHSPDVVTIDKPFTGERPKADALVSATPGLVIGVLTADCGPVLLADHEAGVVAAAHAGWRGALNGVLGKTVEAMERLGARREAMRACVGPTISAAHYEVGPEFVERFAAADNTSDRYFSPAAKAGHAMFDLPSYILARLEEAGVRAEASARCTYAEEENFFSYRRATHRNEPDYGRQIAAIAITTE